MTIVLLYNSSKQKTRYIDAKEPIREKLLFLSPIPPEKEPIRQKQDMGRGDTLNLDQY